MKKIPITILVCFVLLIIFSGLSNATKYDADGYLKDGIERGVIKNGTFKNENFLLKTSEIFTDYISNELFSLSVAVANKSKEVLNFDIEIDIYQSELLENHVYSIEDLAFSVNPDDIELIALRHKMALDPGEYYFVLRCFCQGLNAGFETQSTFNIYNSI